MRKLIVGAAAILVLVGIAYLALFQRPAIMSLFNQGALAAQGYTPAKTPSEAMDSFLRAVKERNYSAAETYLSGEYSEQFHKGAKNGRDLGIVIDDFFAAMKNTGTKSDNVKLILRLMDPFPTDVKVIDVKQDGARAYAIIGEESGAPLNVQPTSQGWDLDLRMIRPLFRSASSRVDLVKEGEGDKAQWKIVLPVTPDLRLCVAYLTDNGSNYVNALKRVDEDMKNDATTKADLESAVRKALTDSK